MSDNKIDVTKLREDLGLDQVDELVKRLANEDKKKAEEAATAAEEKRLNDFIAKHTGEYADKLKEAKETIDTLEKKIGENAETFAKAVEQMQESIEGQSTEIKTLLARREGKDLITTAVGKTIRNENDVEDLMEQAALVKSIMRVENIEDTKFGADVSKAVNDSSSIQVSSEDYETVFSNRILRDIQKRLVVGAMFTELPMTSKLLTMQIEEGRTAAGATWVDASDFGTDASTGGEHTTALTNITFSTFKLACKAYMTDETTEDAITPLLGIIRRRLIEAHAEAIETAFMTGATAGAPRGLITLANDDTNEVESVASGATATSLVPAKDLLKMRRLMGRKGTRMGDLALIVSLDVYYDLIEDDAWQDVDQVGNAAAKLQGQVGRVYGLPVVVSEYFPAKAAGAACAILVYRPDFIVPRQRQVTTEYERIQRQQVDAYYVTQRLNLQRYFSGDNVVALNYAA